MWHASVAFVNSHRVVPLSDWRLMARMRAREAALILLRDVGEGKDFWFDGRAALHLRRKLSAEEIAGIDPAFLACTPIDLAQ